MERNFSDCPRRLRQAGEVGDDFGGVASKLGDVVRLDDVAGGIDQIREPFRIVGVLMIWLADYFVGRSDGFVYVG
jgi:hypothetical protein